MVLRGTAQANLTKKGNIRPLSLELLLQWMIDSWSDIKDSEIKNAFKNCGIIFDKSSKEFILGISNSLSDQESNLISKNIKNEEELSKYSQGLISENTLIPILILKKSLEILKTLMRPKCTKSQRIRVIIHQ